MADKLNCPRPRREMSQAVIVVPTFDPMIRKAASLNASIPAFTKLTTITVTADDDWISEVAKKPVVQAPNRLEATARALSQTTSRHSLHRIAHDLHSINEEGQSAQNIQHEEDHRQETGLRTHPAESLCRGSAHFIIRSSTGEACDSFRLERCATNRHP